MAPAWPPWRAGGGAGGEAVVGREHHGPRRSQKWKVLNMQARLTEAQAPFIIDSQRQACTACGSRAPHRPSGATAALNAQFETTWCPSLGLLCLVFICLLGNQMGLAWESMLREG